MKRKLALVLLVLLVAGLASQAAAAQRVVDPRCGSGAYSGAHYQCPKCSQWFTLDAWSGNGNPPPYPADSCDICGYKEQEIFASYCTCYNPLCVGGVFWSA
jgi:hypothetical protein